MGRLTPQEIHRFAFEGSTDAILVFDGGSGRILDANPATAELYGYSYDQLLELTVDDLCAPADPSGDDGVVPLLHRHLHGDGEPFPVDVSVGTLDVADRPLSVMVVRDITERRRIEAELRRRKVKEALYAQDRVASLGRMAAGMAHEINNPLTYVIGNAALVSERLRAGGTEPTPNGDELASIIDEVHQGATRIQRIVRDLMTFSRSDAVKLGEIDIEEVLDAMIRLAGAEYRERARVVKDYRATPPLAGNEPQLGQVILHLLVNAAHAIPAGDVDRNQICVRTRHEGEQVVIEIEDTGAGIPEDDIEHIFDPFFSSKGLAVASGLGLSICHGIVTGLGGTISVESTPGVGTTFRVTLPAVP